jgi:hypothetical protein
VECGAGLPLAESALDFVVVKVTATGKAATSRRTPK